MASWNSFEVNALKRTPRYSCVLVARNLVHIEQTLHWKSFRGIRAYYCHRRRRRRHHHHHIGVVYFTQWFKKCMNIFVWVHAICRCDGASVFKTQSSNRQTNMSNRANSTHNLLLHFVFVVPCTFTTQMKFDLQCLRPLTYVHSECINHFRIVWQIANERNPRNSTDFGLSLLSIICSRQCVA